MHKKTTQAAPSPSNIRATTRERILHCAESLFAERGIDGVSLREITATAGANSAAAHYHFGSKEALLDKLFTPRAQAIAQRRLELLQVARNKGALQLEDILMAFLLPALDVTQTLNGKAFTRLRARLALEATQLRRAILSRAFDQSSKIFLAALQEALPHISPRDVAWRFHFILGAMVYTMAAPGRIEDITDGAIDTSNSQEALAQFVRFAAAGFRAPSEEAPLQSA